MFKRAIRLSVVVCFLLVHLTGCIEQPVINSLTISNENPAQGEVVLLNLVANGGDHDGLTFLWHSTCIGAFSDNDVSNPTFTVDTSAVGQCDISVTVTSESGGSVNEIATIVINSASLNPVISISRSSGEIPFHVYVSASESTALSEAFPYDNLHYRWDFGDVNADIPLSNPVTDTMVSPNEDQTGPEAAYVFRAPGEYTVTLIATRDLEGEVEEQRVTVNVNVNAWSGETQYFDPAFGDDSAAGNTEDLPKKSWSALRDWLDGGDHRRALVKSGTTMLVDAPFYLSTSHIRIEPYGEGLPPVLLAEPDIGTIIRLSPENEMQDVVLSGLTLNGAEGNASSLLYAALLDDTKKLQHVTLVDMKLVNDDPHIEGVIKAKNMISLQNQNNAYIDDVVIWNTEFERNRSHKNGIYAEMKGHFAVVGGFFSGGDGNFVKDHPIYPAGINHALYRWIDFRPTFSNNFSINSAAKDGLTLQYTLIDGCNITGGRNGVDFTKHTSRTTGWFSDVIIQNSAFHDLGEPSQGYGVLAGSVKRMVLRDNVFYGNPQSDIQVVKDGEAKVNLVLHNNQFWKGAEREDTLRMLDLQNVEMFSAIGNIFVNEGVSGGSTGISSMTIPAEREWVIEANQYWAPSIQSPFYVPGEGGYTFAQWQALGFDQDSLYEDPGFEDPSSGIF